MATRRAFARPVLLAALLATATAVGCAVRSREHRTRTPTMTPMRFRADGAVWTLADLKPGRCVSGGELSGAHWRGSQALPPVRVSLRSGGWRHVHGAAPLTGNRLSTRVPRASHGWAARRNLGLCSRIRDGNTGRLRAWSVGLGTGWIARRFGWRR